MKSTLLALILLLPLVVQERVDEATDAKMRSEELEHSQIMHTLHMLTDRYGPRVTGTPNHEQAAKWAVSQMTQWGLKNAHLEAWEFGHPGWLNESATGHLDAPVRENIKFEVLAWTPSTPGKVCRFGDPTDSAARSDPAGSPATAAPAATGGGGAFWTRARLGPLKTELDQWIADNQTKVKRQDRADRESRRDSGEFRSAG